MSRHKDNSTKNKSKGDNDKHHHHRHRGHSDRSSSSDSYSTSSASRSSPSNSASSYSSSSYLSSRQSHDTFSGSYSDIESRSSRSGSSRSQSRNDDGINDKKRVKSRLNDDKSSDLLSSSLNQLPHVLRNYECHICGSSEDHWAVRCEKLIDFLKNKNNINEKSDDRIDNINELNKYNRRVGSYYNLKDNSMFSVTATCFKCAIKGHRSTECPYIEVCNLCKALHWKNRCRFREVCEWQEFFDDFSKKSYYYDKKSSTVTWDHPRIGWKDKIIWHCPSCNVLLPDFINECVICHSIRPSVVIYNVENNNSNKVDETEKNDDNKAVEKKADVVIEEKNQMEKKVATEEEERIIDNAIIITPSGAVCNMTSSNKTSGDIIKTLPRYNF